MAAGYLFTFDGSRACGGSTDNFLLVLGADPDACSRNGDYSIEENGGGLGLTPMGSERYLSLAKSAAVDPSHSPDEFVSKLAEIMTKARR